MAAQIEGLRVLLESKRGELQKALPSALNADRLARIALTNVQHSPKLLKCTPASIYSAVLDAAQLGLYPDSVAGTAYLVPFFNSQTRAQECKLIVGYKGILALAYRSDKVAWIQPHVVHAGDDFSYKYGTQGFVSHEPKSIESVVTHVWVEAEMHGDARGVFRVMTTAEIDKVKEKSRSGNQGPWVTDWEAMAMKTVLLRLVKFLPQTTELARVIGTDERHEAGIAVPAVDAEFTKDEPAPSTQGAGGK